jgi:hypothetical protein
LMQNGKSGTGIIKQKDIMILEQEQIKWLE